MPGVCKDMARDSSSRQQLQIVSLLSYLSPESVAETLQNTVDQCCDAVLKQCTLHAWCSCVACVYICDAVVQSEPRLSKPSMPSDFVSKSEGIPHHS